ncbi:Lamin Tail Domain [Maribacter arcticus]|uniref:Lamin Tail Domain n=2 Tax=Maribacter arcticus TaxID=561365 RepID=A0A1T5AB97_9FLAO|nr:Lamin Tail Domain [Maribacter arcticus]
MIFKNNFLFKIYVLSIMLVFSACVKNRDFDEPELVCSDEDFSILSISELKNLYAGETVQIQEDWVVKGYVVSSDKSGNFFNILHFQDASSNPTKGLQIELELRDSHLFFDIGQTVFIKLKGLYLGQSNGLFKIGGVFTSFGNRSVGRLPNSVIFNHILVSCDPVENILPKSVSILELNESMVNTLVRIANVEFKEDELGKSFAVEKEETQRTLIDCDDNELILLNSGYSDFQAQIIPDKMGTATGVLTMDKNEFQLIIRTVDDLDFNKVRCEELIDEFTSNSIFISEIADPNNNAGARFLELYNSSNEALSLNGWTLVRYTNSSTEVSSSIDLSDYSINANGLIVISPNALEFETVYGFLPTITVGTNSPADSNGDDNIALIDPFGTVIDIFGVIGEDGSNTNHEFEDGKAERKIEVISGNTVFTESEWIIYNDTGNNGTVNLPQNAPLDFTPGVR